MNKLKVLINRGLAWIWSKVGHVFSDETYLKVRFRLLMGKTLNLKDPHTFSEKLQWLKLYNRSTEYTMMVDKYAVKEYVAGVIGREYIIPTYDVWDRPEDIEWDKLPEKFVLKTTHGGGSNGVVICKNKRTIDKKEAVRVLKNNMKGSDWRIGMEWPYKNVPHRIIAEQYIAPAQGVKDLPDYKFFCFSGEPKYCQVISGRDSIMSIDFFDKNWEHQQFHEPKDYPFAENEPQKPLCFEQMWEFSRLLSQGLPFCRIDFYNVLDKVYFGEMTFFPTSGIGGFDPEVFDSIFGQMIVLPDKQLPCNN